MKKFTLVLTLLLALTLLAGCVKQQPQNTVPATTEAPEVTAQATTEAEMEYEGDASSYYIDEVYAQQIERYYTALSQQWDENAYMANEMCTSVTYYYEGNALDNVGFGFVDLDNDGHWELVIGAILDAEWDPAIFEVWTLVDGVPVMLMQASSRNHYVLEYAQEDGVWYIVSEGANGAANHATHYLMLSEGKLEVVQGVIYDAMADENNPWFLAHDQDWDVSNDEPIDEQTAEAILDSNRKLYTALEYFPYILYK